MLLKYSYQIQAIRIILLSFKDTFKSPDRMFHSIECYSQKLFSQRAISPNNSYMTLAIWTKQYTIISI